MAGRETCGLGSGAPLAHQALPAGRREKARDPEAGTGLASCVGPCGWEWLWGARVAPGDCPRELAD